MPDVTIATAMSFKMPVGLVSYLRRVLELQHARVVVRFPCSSFGAADEVTERLGHVFHCVDQDHL